MSRNIRLFPTYSQKENQTTNHCLLILKMLYEENPKFLSEALGLLFGENFSGTVGVKFIQQRRAKDSVPDGEIFQDSFSVFIETKLGSDFGEKQLLDHLDTLKEKKGKKILIALGNFEQDPTNNPVLQTVETKAKYEDVAFISVSFEQFLQAIQLPYLPKNLIDAVSDLGEYFDENNLLPSWKYRLDVVNCKGSFDSVLEHKIYTCPAQAGSYNHRRSLYFGTYRNKCVEQISQIEAVVDLESEDEASLVWSNVSRPEKELIKIAIERRQKIGESWYPVRVFVLDDMHPTNFVKASSGGMFVSKQYFDIGKLKAIDTADLAQKLRGKTWENYESLITS
ncbi:MAG: hypothetical protein JGK12_28645 [Microcoleus sp. PH2017_01_SCD_O_A]|nr:hypothetical protein [Microcoleus sp. PH2017_01_SCD_O_A]MCC3457407.1 hypothetical protein [Microcoleus sp. PH2017_08_TRC_O_A]MCC3468993.1 hypothetical protein [Microcoleus sp. PH2017_06_SFM_O_A]MCC3512421.1 hypothetical protein [Microcoleus sp. PH2017_17_BER_D_A]MCC3517920.1 hypothetical protein [Microcoleus sp. PH2017_18_LLB_O_A]MCC3586982.1 hypothetical protein [Microcoleus sp. PH2017_30_WIL_O_A]MCC3591888.1 hypothetical protein [Microcoleus sp. PH2017_28_MFU_U_A]